MILRSSPDVTCYMFWIITILQAAFVSVIIRFYAQVSYYDDHRKASFD